MAFPEIVNFIICEDVRREVDGKASLMGFYGAAPDIRILFKTEAAPYGMERLAFYFRSAPGGEGKYNVVLQILDEKKDIVISSPEAACPIKNPRYNTVLVFKLRDIKFPRLGAYSINLIMDRGIHYSTTINIGVAEPEDYT